jgi:hypothetical protein
MTALVPLLLLLHLLALTRGEFTVNVSTLQRVYSLPFPSHRHLTLSALRAALHRVLDKDREPHEIALCRPPRRTLFREDPLTETELDDGDASTGGGLEGVTWSLFSPNSITLGQNVAVVYDQVARVRHRMTACRASSVGQILGRVGLAGWYPEGSRLEPADGRHRFVEARMETREIGSGGEDGIVPISAKVVLPKGSRSIVWMPVGWAVAVAAGESTVVVAEQPASGMYYEVVGDDKAAPTQPLYHPAHSDKTINGVTVIGAVPAQSDTAIASGHVYRLEPSFVFLRHGSSVYELAVPGTTVVTEAGVREYVERVTGTKVVSMGEVMRPEQGVGGRRVRLTELATPPQTGNTNVHSQPPTTTTTPATLLSRYRLRWQTTKPEIKAVLISTAMFVVAVVLGAVYVWVSASSSSGGGGGKGGDPVLDDVERDLALSEQIQRRATPGID